MGIGTNGIVITETGVYFAKEFLRIYYPWHIFKEISLIFDDEKKELLINGRNVINLSCSIIDGNDINLFLKQLRRHL
nr:hypothetical protein [Niallia taxi]